MPIKDMLVEITPPSTPPADAPDERQVETMMIDRGGSRHMWILALIAVVAILGGIVYGGYRIFGGNSEAAAVQTETKAAVDTSVVTISAEWKTHCQGDIAMLSDKLQYYCSVTMPTMQKLSDDNVRLSNELKEQVPGNRSVTPWILVALLGLNSLVCWIVLIRRRKSRS